MGIAGISMSPQNSVPVKQSAGDNYENDIRKRITNLQDKMQTISNDESMSAEQKRKERQAAQEQIQNLNSELRQYQLQKRQEEEAKKQEEARRQEEAKRQEETKQAFETELTAGDGSIQTGLGDRETGVMITLSSTKKQMEGMVRVRTHLEGRLRTAETEEEKAALQKKINHVSTGIGRKITSTANTISDFQKTQKYGSEKKQSKPEAKENIFGQRKAVNINTGNKAEGTNRANLANSQNTSFDNASVIIK